MAANYTAQQREEIKKQVCWMYLIDRMSGDAIKAHFRKRGQIVGLTTIYVMLHEAKIPLRRQQDALRCYEVRKRLAAAQLELPI